MEETMPTTKSPKQVKVQADGCTPDTLELIKGRDSVVFLQSGPKAPTTVHLDNKALFGTTTCAVGTTAATATVYAPKAPGNYTIGITPGAAKKAGGPGTVQVLCLPQTSALGVTGSGSIKVNM
jgi:hypothetical protein